MNLLNPHCAENYAEEEKTVDNPISYQQFTEINFANTTNSNHYEIHQFRF